jgi:hypothetical protein
MSAAVCQACRGFRRRAAHRAAAPFEASLTMRIVDFAPVLAQRITPERHAEGSDTGPTAIMVQVADPALR